MDRFHHPMSSSWLMDLPLQIEQARKLIKKAPSIRSIIKKRLKSAKKKTPDTVYSPVSQ